MTMGNMSGRPPAGSAQYPMDLQKKTSPANPGREGGLCSAGVQSCALEGTTKKGLERSYQKKNKDEATLRLETWLGGLPSWRDSEKAQRLCLNEEGARTTLGEAREGARREHQKRGGSFTD